MRALGSSICLLTLAFMLGACCDPDAGIEPGDGCKPCPVQITRGKITSIKFEDFFMRHQQGDLLLIDSRHRWFFNQGRIPGAVNLPTGEKLDDDLTKLMPDLRHALSHKRIIVVYCNGFGCHDARTAARAISKQGIDVHVFGGGWKAWKKCGLPVESASKEEADLSPQPAS